MTDLKHIIIESRRLALLRFLAEAPESALNTAILQTALVSVGLGASRDQVEADAAWLGEQGLVEVEALGSGMTVVRLTQSGADVAAGRARVPGVRRPDPGL